MNLKLHEITQGFMALADGKDELTEDELQIISNQLNQALQEKSTNIIAYYENLNVLLDGVTTEIKRLQDYKKQIETRIDNYKSYVKTNMIQLNLDKIETPLGKISIAKSPISCEILDEDKIPSKYKTIVQTTKVDKKAIIDDFKQTGEVIDGVQMNTENKNLRIK